MSAELTEAESRRVRAGIKEKYGQVAAAGAGGCFPYPTGREGMARQGYPMELVKDFPETVLTSFCGVGNPFSLGPIYAGEAVLDIGCGAGVDSLVAALLVGRQGRVVGLDLTPEMIARAQANQARLGLEQLSFRLGEAEALPFPNDAFEVVISNGVLNLTMDKAKALTEAHRVLQPGGRLMVADMVLVAALPAEQAGTVESWFQ